MKVLPRGFYTMPHLASMTVDKKELKELLLATGGEVIARGRLYDIKAKNLGAGVYKVSLEVKNK